MTTYVLNPDVETRSLVDLNKRGVHIYACDPSTRLLVACYSFDGGRNVHRWQPWLGQKIPSDLADALHDKDVEIQGWNAISFERLIFKHVCRIDIPAERFHDTMQRARSMALPGSLELCAQALEMPYQKASDHMMRRWMAPLEDGSWASDVNEYEELCRYCDGDVRSEAGLATVLRPLSAEERQDCVVNERINDRGIMVDISLARAAQRYAKDELADICDRLSVLTQGAITSPKQYQRIKTWLGHNLPPELQWVVEPDEDTGKVSFDAAVREELLSNEWSEHLVGDPLELVELVHDGGKASSSKFATMQVRSSDDQRIRGAYNLNGAGQTGRFSSTGLQVHNFIRASLPNIEDVIETILKGVPREELVRTASFDADGGLAFTDRKRRERIKKPYNVLTILSRTLRPSIIAPPGKVLVWRDWSQIEARMLPWLSAENSASEVLEVFASGKDIYTHQAAASFGVPLEDVTDPLRQGGKVQVLAFGFGGGAGAGMRMARTYGLDIDEKTANGWKEAWRATNPWARRFWSKLEIAALMAVRNRDTVYDAGRVSYMCTQDVLFCMLPSGRMICYPFPDIISVPGYQGETDSVVTAMKASYHPKKGTNYWPRMRLWGGFQSQGVTQAEATGSLLRWALRELDANGWPVAAHTHDDILLEVDEDEEQDAWNALEDIMNQPPAIYAGLPLASEGASGYSYSK